MFLSSILTTENSFIVMLLLIFAYFSALLIAMSIHEFGHAHAAYKQGDNTAKVLGRYTLAPFAHVDISGILFLIIFGFGWAKPVPVDPRNFKNGKKSELLVYSAGILTNIIVGTIFAFIYALISTLLPQVFTNLGAYGIALESFLQYVIILNFVFAFFNLLPFNGFDGYRLIECITKPNNPFLLFMQRYGFLLLILLVFTGAISIYINYTAINLANLVLRAFTELFKLLV